jgi:hypothetical protein
VTAMTETAPEPDRTHPNTRWVLTELGYAATDHIAWRNHAERAAERGRRLADSIRRHPSQINLDEEER